MNIVDVINDLIHDLTEIKEKHIFEDVPDAEANQKVQSILESYFDRFAEMDPEEGDEVLDTLSHS